jgi:hypothetical protein
MMTKVRRSSLRIFSAHITINALEIKVSALFGSRAESPYLQFFIGLSGFQYLRPFDPFMMLPFVSGLALS